MRTRGHIASFATLGVLLIGYPGSGVSQQTGNTLNAIADEIRDDLAGAPVLITQQGPITLMSSADTMFPSGGWELKPGAQVLSKIVPALSKLQHTEIVVGGYTDNTPVGPLQSVGITNNLDLSLKRAASVVNYLSSQGINTSLLSAQGFGDTHPVAPNDTPEGRAKNRRVTITLIGDGT